MTQTIEVRLRKPHTATKSKAAQVKTPTVTPLPAPEVPKTLGQDNRIETAKRRKSVLRKKIEDAREPSLSMFEQNRQKPSDA